MNAVERSVGLLADAVPEEPEAVERVAVLRVAILTEVDDPMPGAIDVGRGIGVLDIVLVLDSGAGRPFPGADVIGVLGPTSREQVLVGRAVDRVGHELNVARARRRRVGQVVGVDLIPVMGRLGRCVLVELEQSVVVDGEHGRRRNRKREVLQQQRKHEERRPRQSQAPPRPRAHEMPQTPRRHVRFPPIPENNPRSMRPRERWTDPRTGRFGLDRWIPGSGP